jgi:hypothetical protein
LAFAWQATPVPNRQSSGIIASLPVSVVGALSPEEITIALFCQHLESFHSPQVELWDRLDDYRILQLYFPFPDNQDFPNKFIVGVYYSVLPTDPSATTWISGNGMRASDDWIQFKLDFIDIFIESDLYAMANARTAP